MSFKSALIYVVFVASAVCSVHLLLADTEDSAMLLVKINAIIQSCYY
ncbi:hypothetical protein ACLBR5_09210 [Escherichia coli]